MDNLKVFITATIALILTMGSWGALSSEETFATASLSQESHVFLSALSDLRERSPSLEGVYPLQNAGLSAGNELPIDQGGALLSDVHEATLSDEQIGETVMPKKISETACDYFKSSHNCSSHNDSDSCCVTQDDCSHSCEEYDECCCCCEEEEEGGTGGGSGTTTGGGSGSSGFLTGIDSGGGSGSSDGSDTTGETATTTTGFLVPEPQTYLLLGSALVVVMWLKKRRKEIYCKKK